MIKIVHTYDVLGSVIALHPTADALYFTTNQSILYCVEKVQWSMKSYQIEEIEKPFHPYQHGSAFSPNGLGGYSSRVNKSSSVIFPLPEPIVSVSNRTVNALSIKPKPLEGEKNYFYAHDQAAEVIRFAGENGEYLFTGGTDGKVYMFSTESGELLMSLKPKPDYISHIRLNDRGTAMAYSAYDRSIHVLDLRCQIEMLQSYPGDVIEDSMFFNHSASLYAISRNGVSYCFDLKSRSSDSKALFPTWPSCCVIEESGRYALVGTRSGYLHIIKLADNTQLSVHQIDKKGITSIAVEGSILYLGFENGRVQVIDMYAFMSQFSAAISDKDYRKAKKYLDENFFLSIHPVSELFDEAWEEVLQEIRAQLSMGNKTDLTEIAEPFLSDGEHKQEFDFLYLKQNEFEMFALLVKEKKFFDAYGMLERAPYLDKTENFRKLEGYFNKAVQESKKLIAESAALNMPKVQELLAPFSSIPSKKEIVHTLIKNGEVFLRADEFIKEKNFKGYFTLAAQHPIITEDEMYSKLCTIAENAMKKIRILVDRNDFENAIAGFRQLIGFLPYVPELSKMALEVQLRKKLLAHIQADEMTAIYDLISLHPELSEMEAFIEYERRFDEMLSRAMVAVGKGEIKQTQSIMAPYAEVPMFKAKIRECLRQATWNKLSSLLKAKSIDTAKTVASYYLKEFGKDHDFERLLKKHGLAK